MDINHQLIEGLIEAASKKQDKAAARELMLMYWSNVQSGEPVNPLLARYFADCFYQIAENGVPAAKALYLEGTGYNTKNQDNANRDSELALMVILKAKSYSNQAGSVNRAKKWVVNETGFSLSLIEKAYKAWRKPLMDSYARSGGWPAITITPRKT